MSLFSQPEILDIPVEPVRTDLVSWFNQGVDLDFNKKRRRSKKAIAASRRRSRAKVVVKGKRIC